MRVYIHILLYKVYVIRNEFRTIGGNVTMCILQDLGNDLIQKQSFPFQKLC